MLHKRNVLIGIIGLIIFATLSSPAWALYPNETAFWDDASVYPDTFVIKTPKYDYLDRADIVNNLNTFHGYELNIDENFAWYSRAVTYDAASIADREWAYVNSSLTISYIRIGDLFQDQAAINVFEYGGGFVSRVCGNFTDGIVNPPAPVISGHKWNDLDEDGRWDAGEPALPGWTIILYKHGQKIDWDVTDENGYYEFVIDARPHPAGLGVTPGVFELREENQQGWINTAAPAPVDVREGEAGRHYANNDFGNYRLGRVAGVKWDDSNVNGVRDSGERPLEGWLVVLYKDGARIGETVTGIDGAYRFDNLHYGSYSVWEKSVPDWRQTFPGGIAIFMPGLEPGHHAFRITSGAAVTGRDFGNVELGTIAKVVKHYWWGDPFDVNVTFSEVEVPGILDNLDEFPVTRSTGDDGIASLDRLLPGTYRITIELPEGYREDPPASEHIVNLDEGSTVTVIDRIYDNANAEPRTLGFWKNWRHRYTEPEMLALIARVKTGSQAFADLDLARLDQFLNTSGKKSGIKDMETAQYLVLWLNLASERLGFTTEVNLSSIEGWQTVISDSYGENDGVLSIHELMKQLVVLYQDESLTAVEKEIIKDICDEINNSLLF